MPSTLEKKILARLDKIEKDIEMVGGRLIKLENANKTVEVKMDVSEGTETPETKKVLEAGRPAPTEPKFPVPAEYLNLVHEILNDKFGVRIEPDPTAPAFTFEINVPKEYSNAPNETWMTAKADIRSKKITYGEGLLGVKTYIELIRNNLGPEIQAKIEAYKENGTESTTKRETGKRL